MQFEWDPAKGETNLLKHGITFDVATAVFRDPDRVDDVDDRFDYGELRRKVIGLTDDGLLAVIYTMRGPSCRIISARVANENERKRHGHR